MRSKRNIALLFPVLLWLVTLVLLPLMYIIVLSFLTRGPNGNIVFTFTTENYVRIIDPMYLSIFATSLKVALLTTLISLFIGYPFAYFVARLSEKYRFFVMLLVMIPFWTSSLLRTYGWIILLQTEGVINSLLLWLNIIKTPLKLMHQYGTVLIGTVYMLLPFMILPIYNSVEKLDNTLLEASHDLGAKKVKTFLYITLPLTMPGIIGGVMLVFIPAVGLFFISDLLGGAKTILLGNLIRNQFTSVRNWPFGAALAVIMLIGALLCLFIYRKVSKNQKGELLL